MTGVELFELAVRQAHPASRIPTGYADAQNVVQAINAGHIYRYLEKLYRKMHWSQPSERVSHMSGTNNSAMTSHRSREIRRSARLRKGLNSAEIQPLVQNEDDIILSQPRYHEQEQVMVLDLRGSVTPNHPPEVGRPCRSSSDTFTRSFEIWRRCRATREMD